MALKNLSLQRREEHQHNNHENGGDNRTQVITSADGHAHTGNSPETGGGGQPPQGCPFPHYRASAQQPNSTDNSGSHPRRIPTLKAVIESKVIKVAPVHTKICVRNPAGWLFHSRSRPMILPNATANIRRMAIYTKHPFPASFLADRQLSPCTF